MFLTLFNIFWVAFVSTKISAAYVTINTNSNNGNESGSAQTQDPVDLRMVKYLDISYDVQNDSTYYTEDIVRSWMHKGPIGVQNHETYSNNLNHKDGVEADNDYNKYLLKKMETLTYQVQNLTEILTEMNGQIRKNFSNLSINQNSIRKDIQNGRFATSKSSNGVTYNGLYPKMESRITDDNQIVNFPVDCKDIQEGGNNVSGVYRIQPILSPKSFLVLCDMETRGGGWTHIQKRFDGSQDFNLEWRDYKFGFGDLDGEFWLGLENMHLMTSVGPELLVEMVDIDQNTVYEHYGTFEIGAEPEGYPLSVLKYYSGNAGDSLSDHIGLKFSTKDYDQDTFSENCAKNYYCGWWFAACFTSNLNGKYINLKVSGDYRNQGPRWNSHNSNGVYSLAKTRMLIRKSCD